MSKLLTIPAFFLFVITFLSVQNLHASGPWPVSGGTADIGDASSHHHAQEALSAANDYHSPDPESSVSVIVATRPSVTQRSPYTNLFLQLPGELLQATTCSQRYLDDCSRLLHLSKPHIIFPFHDFW